MQRQVSLAEYKAKKANEGGLEITGDNGEVFTIAPPALWPDEIVSLVVTNDHVAVAKLLLGGADRYDAFVAAGGSAIMLGAIVQDEFGAGLGELSASSR